MTRKSARVSERIIIILGPRIGERKQSESCVVFIESVLIDATDPFDKAKYAALVLVCGLWGFPLAFAILLCRAEYFILKSTFSSAYAFFTLHGNNCNGFVSLSLCRVSCPQFVFSVAILVHGILSPAAIISLTSASAWAYVRSNFRLAFKALISYTSICRVGVCWCPFSYQPATAAEIAAVTRQRRRARRSDKIWI